jgi:hypothetical protein
LHPFCQRKEFLKPWKISVLLDFMDFRGNPLCCHFMFLIDFSLLKYANNTNIGCISSMRKEKINSSVVVESWRNVCEEHFSFR